MALVSRMEKENEDLPSNPPAGSMVGRTYLEPNVSRTNGILGYYDGQQWFELYNKIAQRILHKDAGGSYSTAG